MTMIASIPTKVKPSRPRRPFGLGILPAPAPRPSRPDVTARFLVAKARVVARRDAALRRSSGPAASARIADRALALIARLRAAAGRASADRKAIAATAPVEAPAPVAKSATVADIDAIPAAVARVRITEGPRSGVWVRSEREGWASHWRAEADAGRWLAEVDADKEYAAARVAILADAPAPAPVTRPAPTPAPTPAATPAPRRRPAPTDADRVFEHARSIGLANEGPVPPPAALPAALVSAWQLGMAEAGEIVGDRDREYLNDVAARAAADELLAVGSPWL